MKNSRYLLLLLLLIPIYSFPKTKKFGTWVEIEVNKKINKKLDFSLIPEVRFQDDFQVDEYIFEGKLGYAPYKFLDFAASYRYNTNVKNSGNEHSHSAVFDVTGSTGFDRFDASLRGRFTNDTDGDEIPWKNFFFRPRFKLQYNIKGSKIEPFANYELFLNLNNGSALKGRFDIGATRKIGDFHRVGLYYRLQDYFGDKQTVHILGIDYRFRF